MNLTPIDVEQKAFTQALRGYQMDEVDDFLDEVVSTLRNYEQRLREAHDKIRVLESESAPTNRGGGDESEIARAILTAQRSADRLLAEARTQADEIRSEAVAETSQLKAQRDSERTRLQQEVTTMSDLVGALRNKLAELSTAVTAQLDDMDSEIESTSSGLGDDDTEDLPTDVAEEELLDDFDAVTAEEDIDEAGPQDEENPPTFSDIFPEPEVDLTEAPKSRVTSRPWERG
jgi:cell division initiation protein